MKAKEATPEALVSMRKDILPVLAEIAVKTVLNARSVKEKQGVKCNNNGSKL